MNGSVFNFFNKELHKSLFLNAITVIFYNCLKIKLLLITFNAISSMFHFFLTKYFYCNAHVFLKF